MTVFLSGCADGRTGRRMVCLVGIYGGVERQRGDEGRETV